MLLSVFLMLRRSDSIGTVIRLLSDLSALIWLSSIAFMALRFLGVFYYGNSSSAP